MLFTCNLYFAIRRFHLIAPHGVVPAAANGSGTPSSSSFYIRPAIATIRVAVAVDTIAAAAPTTADDNDDNDDDYANEYDLTPAVSLFIEFQNRFGRY